ncbi:hypothetical protein MZI42_00755 [Clostridioides difficile]|nr:hypothetical protein [Clostridioides difficile]MCE4899760.1 hypothetical protein [Clostridioides difficile]MCI2381181.1 hypothetical protein [Clostridioides difficile]MCK3699381.1 hypothetical protein [Clostridioides difficile]MCO4290658.1 hypothetical protein [Clostridioides difficile]MCO4713001.1 hypothetical protein [Clostridioides difficile]
MGRAIFFPTVTKIVTEKMKSAILSNFAPIPLCCLNFRAIRPSSISLIPHQK